MHRRAFLNTATVAAAASLPGCMVVAPAAASICKAAPYLPAADDAHLTMACQYAIEARRGHEAICTAMDEQDPARGGLLDKCRSDVALGMALAIRLAAGTNEGLEAKARLLVARFPLAPDGSHYDCPSPDELLALSMAADILARAS
jgi:hypothetical protein